MNEFDKREYQTPPEIFNPLKELFHFSYDLAASKENYLLPMHFTKEMNALDKSWHELKGWLWLNPPYGRTENPIWTEKCHEEALLGANIVALVPASVGSTWYNKYVKMHTHKFVEGRIKFLANGERIGSPRFDSMLVYYSQWI